MKPHISTITDSTSARPSVLQLKTWQPDKLVWNSFLKKLCKRSTFLNTPWTICKAAGDHGVIEKGNKCGLVTFLAETSKEKNRCRTAGHIFIAKTFVKEHLKIRFSRNRNAWALYAKSICRNMIYRYIDKFPSWFIDVSGIFIGYSWPF